MSNSSVVRVLVALVLVAMGLVSTPNTAWAKSTPVVRTSADTGGATSMDPRPTFNRQDILALQGRASALETKVSDLDTRVSAIRVPSTKQIKVDIHDLQVRIDAAETALKGKVSQADFDAAVLRITAVEDALPNIRERLTRLEERVDQLETDMRAEQAEPKAGLLMGIDCMAVGHDSVSDLGVKRFGAGCGFNSGVVVETASAGLLLDGGVDWIASGLGGTHWHGSGLGLIRRAGKPAIGLGLMGQTTLLGESGDTYYHSWGLGPEARILIQSQRLGENKVFSLLSFRVAAPFGPVFTEGEQSAKFRPSLELGFGLEAKLGGRGPRRR